VQASFGIAPLSALIYASLTLALIGVDLLIPSNDSGPSGSYSFSNNRCFSPFHRAQLLTLLLGAVEPSQSDSQVVDRSVYSLSHLIRFRPRSRYLAQLRSLRTP
jgi:hypothetical protein